MKRNVKLRVKLKSLAEEAKIIRIEERRANEHGNYSLQNQLREHRVGIVRYESRHTLLAYQYLRGFPYSACECPGSASTVNPDKILSMVQRYGDSSIKRDDIQSWINGGQALSQAA